MNDTDKILAVLARLEAGQKALEDGQKTLQNDVKSFQNGQNSLQEGQKALQTDVKGLQTDVKALKEGQQALDLKVETFHAEQTKANTEILTILTDMNELNAQAIDTRVSRIEKHLNLPPLK